MLSDFICSWMTAVNHWRTSTAIGWISEKKQVLICGAQHTNPFCKTTKLSCFESHQLWSVCQHSNMTDNAISDAIPEEHKEKAYNYWDSPGNFKAHWNTFLFTATVQLLTASWALLLGWQCDCCLPSHKWECCPFAQRHEECLARGFPSSSEKYQVQRRLRKAVYCTEIGLYGCLWW